MTDCCCYFPWEFVHTQTVDGPIYVYFGATTVAIADVDNYSPTSDSWQNKTDGSPARFASFGAVILGDYAVVAGGQASTGLTKKTDAYEFGADSWSARTDYPSPTRARSQFAGGSGIGSGHIVYGINSDASTSAFDNDRYDPGGDSWAARTNCPTPERDDFDAFVIDVGIHCVRTFGPATHDHDRYSTTGNSWAARTDLPGTAARGNFAGTAIGDDGYVIAGGVFLRDVDVFSQTGNSWSTTTDCPTPGRQASVAPTADSNLFLISGQDSGGNRLLDNDKFDPVSETWTSVQDMPSPGRTQSIATGA